MRLNRFFFGSLMIAGALLAQQGAPPDAGEGVDEPGRAVARVSVLSGDASVRRSDSGEWIAAAINAPLLAGDSVSVAAGGAAEIQLDNANFARLAGDTEVRLSELDNGRQQVQLARGLVTWRVLRDSTSQTEISTPLAAVRPGLNAAVRIEVGPDGSTRITVRHGEAEVYTQRGTEHVREGNSMSVRGEADYQIGYAAAHDQWDTWNDDRDKYLLRAQSPRYVSEGVYGAEDLDNYGRWDYDAQYGNVWVPTVASGWAPYQDGHWVLEPYYGWTWVDSSPWGWAPFHYGSWYQRAGFGWAWFPGRRYERAWWRPALVGFVGFGGGGGFGFGYGNIGWVPLAPYERYHPWYGRGWTGGRNVVVNNFNIRNTNITNVYRNARANGGVTAVSTADFQRGNFRNRVTVDAGRLQQGNFERGQLAINAGSQHTRFTDRQPSAAAPRSDLTSQRFYSRSPQTSNGAGTASQQNAQQQPQRSFQQGNQQPDRGERFGRQALQSNQAPQATEAPRMTTNPSWGRFGSPQANPQANQQANQQANPQADSGRGFGNQRGAMQVPQQQQQQQQSQPVQPSQQRERGGFYNGPSRQVQVAPPIVRERESAPAPTQNYDRRGGGSFGSPSPYRGGDRGNYSAPAPQAAPAPRSESPRAAPSFRGGGEARQESRPAPRAEAAPQPRGGERSGGGSNSSDNRGDRGSGHSRR